MALDPVVSAASANAAVDAQAARLNGGFVDIYTAPKPAGPSVAITTQTKLARLTLANPAFAAGVAGIAVANAVGSDTSADATGTAAWTRMRKSDETAEYDGTAGVGTGFNLNLSTVSLFVGQLVQITSLQIGVGPVG